jgi:hypothetical protein
MLRLPVDSFDGDESFAATWNDDVIRFAENPVVEKELALLYDTNRDVRALQRLAMLPVARSVASHSVSKNTAFCFEDGVEVDRRFWVSVDILA